MIDQVLTAINMEWKILSLVGMKTGWDRVEPCYRTIVIWIPLLDAYPSQTQASGSILGPY